MLITNPLHLIKLGDSITHYMLLDPFTTIFVLIILINEKKKPLFQDLVFLNLNILVFYTSSICISS